MANFCLLPKQIEEFKKALKEKEITATDLLHLDHEALVEKLRPYAGNASEQVATLFEEKIILKNKVQGLKNAVNKLTQSGRYSPEEKARLQQMASDYRAAQQERIFNPKEGESYLGGLVEDATGLKLPKEAAQKIFALNKELEQFKEQGKNDLLGVNKDFLDKQRELNDYLATFDKKPALVSIRDNLATLYKNFFIGLKTGIKTASLGTVNATIEAIARRFGDMKAIGSVDLGVKKDFVVQNIKLGAQTGVNTILKNSLESGDAVFGKSEKGLSEFFGGKDTVEEGNKYLTLAAKGLNAVSRGLKYVTIDILHKAPMLLNSSLNFADALDISASTLAKTDLAKSQNMDATAIFKDAVKVEPQTELGKIARARSQEDSFRVLNINNTPLSEVTMNLQRALNKQVPTLGSYLIPMAKVPSNVIYNNLENFGLGFGTGTYNIIKGLGELHNLKTEGQADSVEGVKAGMQVRNGVRTLIRTFGLIGAATLITMYLTKYDFKEDNYGNTYIRLGNYWLSTNAFGGASDAVAGIMLGKTGKNGFLYDYGAGVVADEAKQAPLVSSIADEATALKNKKILPNLTPMFVQDIQKAKQQQSLMPIFFGSLIKTEQEVQREARQAAQKRKKK